MMYNEIFTLIMTEMNWDKEKVELWFNTPNPHLGGFTPNEMIALGKIKKVEKWIKTALDENKRD